MIKLKMAVIGCIGLMIYGVPAAVAKEKCKEDGMVCARMMSDHLKNRGWVGIEYEADEESGHQTIKNVIGGSPAAEAGLRAGDVLVALDGHRFGTVDKKEMKAHFAEKFKPGNRVTYLYLRGGEEMSAEVHLGMLPDQVMAQWIGQHILHDHIEPAETVADKP